MTPLRLLMPLAALTAVLTAGCSSTPGAAGPTSPTPAPGTATAPETGNAAGAETPAPTSAAPPSAAATAMVTISNFDYQLPASVPAGRAITVINKDHEAHTLTVGGGAGVRAVVQGGATVTVAAPAKAGRYPVSCDFHGSMHATLVVS